MMLASLYWLVLLDPQHFQPTKIQLPAPPVWAILWWTIILMEPILIMRTTLLWIMAKARLGLYLLPNNWEACCLGTSSLMLHRLLIFVNNAIQMVPMPLFMPKLVILSISTTFNSTIKLKMLTLLLQLYLNYLEDLGIKLLLWNCTLEVFL